MYKLYTATIEITRRCNAKCVHCIIGAGQAKPEELTTNEILTLIEDLHKKHGLTVVMVSHNMNDIARLADRVLVMHEGEVAFLGTPEDIFTHYGPELRKIGLGIPHAQRLSNELRELGFQLPEKLYSPESLADELVKLLNCGKAATGDVDAAEEDPDGVDAAEEERR